MCGIAGYIGHSKAPEITFQLITSLFKQIEVRGIDAAGFWGTESNNGRTLYHKEPIRASEFIEKKIWKNVEKLNPNLLIIHARGATPGVGTPFVNKNNHPFTNSEFTVGLAHNGRILPVEYYNLKKKYKVESECDSEMFLRIFEGGNRSSDLNIKCNDDLTEIRLKGIRDIWAQATTAHMAITIGERFNDHRRLWLFRNIFRTLWLIDLRESLGQIFFCSTPNIWNLALHFCPKVAAHLDNVKLIELPTEEIWSISISDSNQIPSNDMINKYNVDIDGFDYMEYKHEPLDIPQNSPKVKVYENINQHIILLQHLPLSTITAKY